MHTEYSRWLRSRLQPWAVIGDGDWAWHGLGLDRLSAEAANDEAEWPRAA